MSFSLSNQQQAFGGLPQSLVAAASGGGALGASALVVPYAIPGGNTGLQPSSNGAAEIDLVALTPDPNGYTNPSWEVILDLTNMTNVRMLGRVTNHGPSGQYWKLKYSPNNTTYADLVSGGLSFLIATTGWKDTGWLPLVAGAKGAVYIHPFTANGDNFVTTAIIQPLYLQFS